MPDVGRRMHSPVQPLSDCGLHTPVRAACRLPMKSRFMLQGLMRLQKNYFTAQEILSGLGALELGPLAKVVM